MVKGVTTSIITVAVLMGSLVGCSGSDSELADVRSQLEEPEEQQLELVPTPQPEIKRHYLIGTLSLGVCTGGIAFASTRAWVAASCGDAVVGIKNGTFSFWNHKVVDVGGYPTDVTTDGAHIWVTNYDDGTVSKINTIKHEYNIRVNATIPVGGNPKAITFDGTNIWVANWLDDSVSKINASTNTVDAVIPVDAPFDLVSTGNHIWVANSNLYTDSVSKIDITTNTVTSTVRLSGICKFSCQTSGIAYDGKNIWVSNNADDTVLKIDEDSNEVIAIVPVGSEPLGMAFDGTSIWVANYGDSTVSKIDVTKNILIATVPVGDSPEKVEFDGSSIWVTSGDGSITKIGFYDQQSEPDTEAESPTPRPTATPRPTPTPIGIDISQCKSDLQAVADNLNTYDDDYYDRLFKKSLQSCETAYTWNSYAPSSIANQLNAACILYSDYPVCKN